MPPLEPSSCSVAGSSVAPHAADTGLPVGLLPEEETARQSLTTLRNAGMESWGGRGDSVSMGVVSSRVGYSPDEVIEKADALAKKLVKLPDKDSPLISRGNFALGGNSKSGGMTHRLGPLGRVSAKVEWKKLPGPMDVVMGKGKSKLLGAFSADFERPSEHPLFQIACQAEASNDPKDLNDFGIRALHELVPSDAFPENVKLALNVVGKVFNNQKTSQDTIEDMARFLHLLVEEKSEPCAPRSQDSSDRAVSRHPSGRDMPPTFADRSPRLVKMARESGLAEEKLHWVDRAFEEWAEKPKMSSEKEISLAHEMLVGRLNHTMNAKSMYSLVVGLKNLMEKSKRVSNEDRYFSTREIQSDIQKLVDHPDFGHQGKYGDDARLNLVNFQKSAIDRMNTLDDLQNAADVLGKMFERNEINNEHKFAATVLGTAFKKREVNHDSKIMAALVGSNAMAVRKIFEAIGESCVVLFKKETSLIPVDSSSEVREHSYPASRRLLERIFSSAHDLSMVTPERRSSTLSFRSHGKQPAKQNTKDLPMRIAAREVFGRVEKALFKALKRGDSSSLAWARQDDLLSYVQASLKDLA